MNTIVDNNVYRKIGELLIINKFWALDLPDPVKNPHLGSKKRYLSVSVNISPSHFLIYFLCGHIYYSLIIIALHPMECKF